MTYQLTLTREEERALMWVADRYSSAEVFFDSAVLETREETDGVVTYNIPEHIAWRYEEELEQENGGGLLVPPCVGGTLADKLIAFREAIV